jgi:hypothetical protein
MKPLVIYSYIIWNRHGLECSRIWKLSGNFIKKCRDFLGRDILGTTFFRAESSLIQSSCRSFIRVIVPYERGYETSGSPLRFMLRRSSLVKCVSVLPGNRCLQNVEFFFLRQYVQPCLLKNPKYTFYTIKSSLKLAY